jgi:phosphatidate phosphatase APP1
MRGYISGIKESVQQNYAGLEYNFRGVEDFDEGLADTYTDSHITKSKKEEMILFPSYSRRHISKRTSLRQSSDPNYGEGAPQGGGDSGQAIQQHWDRYEEKNALIDVDIRGWIYSPHKGAMSRKQRLAVGIARQLAGLGGTGNSPPSTEHSSRATSPHPLRKRMEDREQQIIDEEAEKMISTAQAKSEKASRGEYSEHQHPLERRREEPTNSIDTTLSTAQRRAAWSALSEMTPEQSARAHAHLMNRLGPFFSTPMLNSPVSVFFYNDEESRQRTIYTNTYGQFALRAALDFIPTHVRVLASENLSATQEVHITEARGISVISDIDDTVKHTDMLTGAREAFRNTFLRNLDDLVIDGVQSWFTKLADLGVQFHYVSNSPWQLFPTVSRFYSSAGLPAGSFHLKQYSGMLQGIFEPVAERKKSTLDRIARDFPERRFILIGDSGEADLEVYLDFVRDNPGRVLGIFIRDVTTPDEPTFLSLKSGSGSLTPRPSQVQPASSAAEAHDPDLEAAIQASLREFEDEDARRRGVPLAPRPKPERLVSSNDDLLTFSDSDSDSQARAATASQPQPVRRPPPPAKPSTLRGTALDPQKRAPPLPTRRSSTVSAPARPTAVPARNTPPPPTPPPRRAATLDPEAPPPPPPRRLPVRPATTAPRLPQQDGISTSPSSTGGASYVSGSSAVGLRQAAARVGSRVGSALSSVYYGDPSSSTSTTDGNGTGNGTAAGGALATTTTTTTTTSSSGTPSGAASPSGRKAAGGTRVELWRKRWAGAEAALRREGVVLRSWRVGGDAAGECVALVRRERDRR